MAQHNSDIHIQIFVNAFIPGCHLLFRDLGFAMKQLSPGLASESPISPYRAFVGLESPTISPTAPTKKYFPKLEPGKVLFNLNHRNLL